MNNSDFVALSLGLVLLLIGILAGAAAGGLVFFRRGRELRDIGEENIRANLKLAEEALAKERTANVAKLQQERLEFQEQMIAQHKKMETEWAHWDQEHARQDRSLKDRQKHLQQRQREANAQAAALDERAAALERQAGALADAQERQMRELERISQLSRPEAEKELLAHVEKETRRDVARVVRDIEAQTQQIADQRAREIISLSLERVASDHIAEQVVATVSLPTDEMKGRIIGRQGRNIRSIEQALGVDIVVDDTPESIVISCFDPVRREVARMVLAALVRDGRIHPARIEKEVSKAKAIVDEAIMDAGQQALLEVGLPGLHRELQKLLGGLKFRTSYGQNQLYHAVETAHLAAMIAEELHGDVQSARVGGLLHDIGKAVTHEEEGPHAIVGARIARKYGINEKIANCIEAHHHEVEMASMEAVIVATADAVSGARPGARRISTENYYQRIRELEEVATDYDAVKQAFALQAGRELRVLVKPEDIDDKGCVDLSEAIANQIHDTMQYPGQIKVTVIRESRSEAVAV